MAILGHRGLNLQMRIFFGLILVSLLCVIGTTFVSYLVIKRVSHLQNENSLRDKSLALTTALDYAISHHDVTKDNIARKLRYKLIEISDVNNVSNIVLYDEKGNFLVSNRDEKSVKQKQIPPYLLDKILNNERGVLDYRFIDEKDGTTYISSYRILRDNPSLDTTPIAIAYFPYYYQDSQYMAIFSKHLQFIILVNLLAIVLCVFISWSISKNITKTITNISSKISDEGKELKPLKYSSKDELSVLIRAYNRMIYQLQEQTQLKAQMEKEKAWRAMAKQVAHEVKNPLTPMKLTIQNFERKFDPQDSEIKDKVTKMSKILVDQIDLIAEVAGAFSEFAELPNRDDKILNLNEEVNNIVEIFNKKDIFVHSNKNIIKIKFDRIYIGRIMTNLITNAQQAQVEDRKPIINIELEQFNRKVSIKISDNGHGIEKEKLEHIFEPNFTTKNSGMGLGLAMVRKMVEEYKGSISVRSELEKGAEFTVNLPVGVK